MTLTKLPIELQLQIIKDLPYRDKAILRTTSHYFKDIIPAFDLQDLLAAERENYAEDNNLFACKYCMTLRHESCFSKRSCSGRHLRRTGCCRSSRFCHDCGPRERQYPPGRYIEFGGKKYIFCSQCHVLTTNWLRNIVAVHKICSSCYILS
ncbi:hypothetical protein ACMFMF_009204 [Clarireedia jacksonii]